MLAGLAAGNHPSHPTGMVSEYLLDWWKRSGPPMTMEILWKENQAQLPECLEFHRAVHRSNPVPQIGIALTLGRKAAPPPILEELSCSHCKRYQRVAIDALDDLQAL